MAEEDIVDVDIADEEDNTILNTYPEDKFINCRPRRRKDFIELITFSKQFFPKNDNTEIETMIQLVNFAEDILDKLEKKQYDQCLSGYNYNIPTKNCVCCPGCNCSKCNK